jgi:excisionase family DNA binding protein
MPRPKSKPMNRTQKPGTASTSRTARAHRNQTVEWPEVLTLAEAAAYLRVPEAELARTAGSQGLPGRIIGSEWRFSRDAIQDWLRLPSMKHRLLQSAGSWKDDPYLDELLREIERQRERSIAEDGS